MNTLNSYMHRLRNTFMPWSNNLMGYERRGRYPPTINTLERRELVAQGRRQPGAFARPVFTGHVLPKARAVR